MLVLSRKSGERLVLTMGRQVVTVELLRISGNRVQIGVDAPIHIRVAREEVLGKGKSNALRRETA